MISRLPSAAGYPLAALAGAFAGWIDLHNRSVIPTVLVLFTAGWCLTFLWAKHAISWIVLLGASIPVTHLIARQIQFQTPYPQQPIGWDFLLPFLPASAGSGLGILAAFLAGNRLSLKES